VQENLHMPVIACLGWGSLIWDPKDLPVQSQWFTDGPLLQVEFLRQSKDGRLTLVLDHSASAVRSLWAVMATAILAEAKEALRKREDIPEPNAPKHVKAWARGDAAPALIIELPQWAESRGIDAVVWTALPPKFKTKNGTAPTIDEAAQYLSGLTGEERDRAENYIRFAPRQIDTPFRRRIEADLQWASREPDL
jgi:hypothetical protein